MLKRDVTEMGVIPWGYGVAYGYPTRFMWACYPFGLHILVGQVRKVYIALKFWWAKDAYWDAYMAGYQAGLDRQPTEDPKRLALEKLLELVDAKLTSRRD